MIGRAMASGVALWIALGMSASADPAPNGIDERLGALLGQEHAALGSMRNGHVARILTPPQGEEAARYDAVWLQGLPKPEGGAELRCLAQALYFEARGESIQGQFAVGEVILNRVDSPQYPNSICDVVYQGTGQRNACQFSFTCDGNSESIGEPAAYAISERIARLMKDGVARELTDGATHFHTTAVNPRWARVFPRTAQIGVHVFYRQPIRLSSN